MSHSLSADKYLLIFHFNFTSWLKGKWAADDDDSWRCTITRCKQRYCDVNSLGISVFCWKTYGRVGRYLSVAPVASQCYIGSRNIVQVGVIGENFSVVCKSLLMGVVTSFRIREPSCEADISVHAGWHISCLNCFACFMSWQKQIGHISFKLFLSPQTLTTREWKLTIIYPSPESAAHLPMITGLVFRAHEK